ncbi:hypothetical protein BASA50_005928 [Batrachochytrium salamandrivorans]|uniref:Uncharacterized protein n=1 Tax=Batrachochytrium salamandrivorans TaxID=1357716 RepID=A0ABQ8FBR4_9FUNG|nr:hypothetical protein BASA60_008788 [Batrachochytrium salamandrivorans]KAH6595285.1 hypothetical protein BASA50_005928 [Batrachochytrium salamandrivorans]KAH9264622.1 hypothetical protein BASA83_011872 [Batrachochytrium salamandrivorans]
MHFPIITRRSQATTANAMLMLLSAVATSVSATPTLHDLHKTTVHLNPMGLTKKPVVNKVAATTNATTSKSGGKDGAKAKALVPVEPSTSASHFVVSVQRVDMLVEDGASDDDDKTSKADTKTSGLVGAKYSQVLLTFDVNPVTGKVVVNDVPVPMGISQVVVHAKTIISIGKKTDRKTALAAFDKGIIKVEVAAVGSDVHREGIVIRRIVIAERIIEVNGKMVTQGDRIQQVIEIFPDGTVVHGKPCNETDGSEPLTLPAAHKDDTPAVASKDDSDCSDKVAAKAPLGNKSKMVTGTLSSTEHQSIDSADESSPVAPHVHAYNQALSWIHSQKTYVKVLMCLSWSMLVAGISFFVLHIVSSVVSMVAARRTLCQHQPVAAIDVEGRTCDDYDAYNAKYQQSLADAKTADADGHEKSTEPLPAYCPDAASPADPLLARESIDSAAYTTVGLNGYASVPNNTSTQPRQ